MQAAETELSKSSNTSLQEYSSSEKVTIRPELHKLITELLLPRITRLRHIAWTRMVAEPRPADYDDDWWPDYAVYSHKLAITDMRGLLCHAQCTLRGLPADLKTISDNFHLMYDTIKLDMDTAERRRYRIILSLMKDMITFTHNFDVQCNEMLRRRFILSERARITEAPEDRVQLKCYDERSFVNLHTEMSNLKRYMHDFCALFIMEDQ